MADGLPKRILKVCLHEIISELVTFLLFMRRKQKWWMFHSTIQC